MLEDFRKDEDLAEKTFSAHAEVFQPIAMCFKPKKTNPGPTRKLRPGRRQLSQASLISLGKLDPTTPWNLTKNAEY